jgi:cytochrome c oxidase cbb3-type subunit I
MSGFGAAASSKAAHMGMDVVSDAIIPPRVDQDLIKAHSLAAILTLIISAIFGTIVAVKFTYPDFLGSYPWATWGRLRYDHTQGILWGWLCNAFLATLYHFVPRLADRPVTSRRLGWVLFWAWNLGVVLSGWSLVLAGLDHWLFAAKPLSWTEFPAITNIVTEVCLALWAVQFVGPLLTRNAANGLYVSAWYIIGGVVFSFLSFPVGSLVPELAPGAMGAAFSGLWIHDAVGLLVTPFTLAIAYAVIPAVTRRPIYSHFLSMIGFWGLFFVYPLNGTHHYVYSALPMDTQKAAIVASVYLGADVILVVTNLLMSLRDQGAIVLRNIPLRYVWTGIIFYLLVSLQGSFQALMPVQALVHFTDWKIGHSHLAMLGFATFIAAGGVAHVWQKVPGTRYNAAAMAWSYWLITTGLLVMFFDLTAAGLVEAHLWQDGSPWIDSVRAVASYWGFRDASAAPILAGFVAFLLGLTTGPLASNTVEATSLDFLEAAPADVYPVPGE